MIEHSSFMIAPTMAALMAEVILTEITEATDGHCLRINHLSNALCLEIVPKLRERWRSDGSNLIVNVLATPGASPEGSVIRSDKAIEIRNRKRGVFCLFVPAGSDNLTASSLGNSFAELNGAELIHRALKNLLERKTNRQTKRAVAAVRQAFLNTSIYSRPTDFDLLEFALAAVILEFEGNPTQIGKELWRVGLLPDCSPTYADQLRKNRSLVAAIARPRRITAPLPDRLSGLGLSPESARRLETELRRERLDNVKSWTRHLGENGNAFDSLIFLENEQPADVESVSILSFRDERGVLNTKNASGLRQDSAGTPLFATVGDGKKLAVKWETNPKKTTVAMWRIDIVPADTRRADEVDFYDLPGVSIKKGTARKATIKLNLGQLGDEDIPNYAVRVKVAALSSAGDPLVDAQDQEIVGFSEEFYLTKDTEGVDIGGGQTRERSSDARSIAEGLLNLVVQRGLRIDQLTSPQRQPNGLTTRFTMRANERESVTITQISSLFALQRKALQNPGELGVWSVRFDEDRLIEADEVLHVPPSGAFNSEASRKFLATRKSFFGRITKLEAETARDSIETADWTNDSLIAAVRSYANAWTEWLSQADGDELHYAISVDTLRVVVQVGDQADLDALVAMPSHPLRALWIASHSALLNKWTQDVLGSNVKPSSSIDLHLLSQLAPSNLPMLFHHPGLEPSEPVAFFRNLDFGHGVAIRTHRSNEAEQFERLRVMLGLPGGTILTEAPQQQRAALTLKRFLDSHPYADPLRIALVHPDDGSFLRNAIDGWKQLERTSRAVDHPDSEDEAAPLEVPSIEIAVYQHGGGLNSTPIDFGAEDWRRADEVSATQSDHLRPFFSMNSFSERELLNALTGDARHQHHLAIVQDLGEPKPVTLEEASESENRSALPLYGLIARYTSTVREDGHGQRISFWINAGATVAPHPVDKGLSESMIRAIAATSTSTGRLLGSPESNGVALSVALGDDEKAIVDKVHAVSDWVITVDRFVGPEIFDQPDHPDRKRTYILDAAPTFQDGMSRQSFVTTSSREEVELILLRAMGRLGFGDLHESVGHLLSSLRKVSGRLVLDALQSDQRAAEVVGIGAVMLWLQSQGELNDTVIVPIDAHVDLFSIFGSNESGSSRRADLALFRFISPKKLEIRIVEVKSRSTVVDDIVNLMAEQMRSSGNAIEDRLRVDRVDAALQRARLAQVLRFYLDRAVRYRTFDAEAAMRFRAALVSLERGSVDVEREHRGYVIALSESDLPGPISTDIFTTITFLSIPEIAQAANSESNLGEHVEAPGPHPEGGESEQESKESVSATDEPIDPFIEAAPDEREPARAIDDQNVLLGFANGRPIVWQPRVAGSPHMFVLGIPGQGKSVTIDRVLTELNKSNTPSFILDFHGTFVDTKSSFLRDTKFTLLDAADGLPFSPFSLDAAVKEPQVNQQAREISNIVDHVFGLGDIQRDAFYTTLRDLYIRHGYGRSREGDPEPEPIKLADIEKALHRKEREQGVRNLIARTRALFDFDLFTAGYESDRFDDLLQNGVVIGLNHLGGDEIALSLSSFLLRRLYFSITKWPVADRLRLAIVLDEAHRLARDITLPKIMKEARKFGVAVVIASQGLADFHPDIVSNAGTKISFRINYPDSRKVAGFFRGTPGEDLPAALEGLGVGQALVQTPEMSRVSRVSMLRPGE